MNLLLRFIRVLIHAFFRPSLSIFEESVLWFRVYPHDIDLNKHMTNSRYLSLMDLGRIDLSLRSPLSRYLVQGQWKAVLGSVIIQFQRPLKLFQKVSLHTYVVGWDTKCIYLAQKIMFNQQAASYAFAKCLFLDESGIILTDRILRVLGPSLKLPSHNINPPIHCWKELEEILRTYEKTEEDNRNVSG